MMSTVSLSSNGHADNYCFASLDLALARDLDGLRCATEGNEANFFDIVLPNILRLALSWREHFKDGVKILPSIGTEEEPSEKHQIVLSNEEAACILATALLGALPEPSHLEGVELPFCNSFRFLLQNTYPCEVRLYVALSLVR